MRKIIIFIGIVLINGCNQDEKRNKNVKIKDQLIDSYHKSINLPDSLVLFYDGDKRPIALSNYLTENLKILSILGNDCQKCTVSELLFWDDFSMNYENIDKIELILVYSGPNYYFTNVLSKEIGVQIPVLLDKSGIIQNQNTLFDDPLYRTVLLDKENRILLVGNFINNMKLKKLYFEEIDKQLN